MKIQKALIIAFRINTNLPEMRKIDMEFTKIIQAKEFPCGTVLGCPKGVFDLAAKYTKMVTSRRKRSATYCCPRPKLKDIEWRQRREKKGKLAY